MDTLPPRQTPSFRGWVGIEVGGRASRTRPDGGATLLKRLLAFLLDILVLAFFGLILGGAFFDMWVALGGWTLLFGLVFAGLYFTIMDSALCNGQTVGKRALRICVVGPDGEPVAPLRAFARFAVLATPYFLLKAPFSQGTLLNPEQSVLLLMLSNFEFFLIFGIEVGILYLFLFNRGSGQSLHDLAGNSYVAAAEFDEEYRFGPMWKGHYLFGGTILAFVFFLPYFVAYPIPLDERRELYEVKQEIAALPAVAHASLVIAKRRGPVFGKKADFQAITVSVRVDREVGDFDTLAEQIAYLGIHGYDNIVHQVRFNVRILYGYDMGIASWQTVNRYRLTVSQWNQRFGYKNPLEKDYLQPES